MRVTLFTALALAACGAGVATESSSSVASSTGDGEAGAGSAALTATSGGDAAGFSGDTGPSATSGCGPECRPAPCGDGVCSPPERFTSCPEDCPSFCGDRWCASTESAKTCPADCPPFCGDGELGPGELCDDGNAVDADACSNGCIPARLVFVTSAAFTGALGGISGADQKCTAAAAAGKLPGTFRAWLSDLDATNEPAKRFGSTGFSGWYALPGPFALAHGWEGLTGTDLLVAIDRDETGETIIGQPVAWTNTRRDGERSDSVAHCLSWTSAEFAMLGRQGRSDASILGGQWSDTLDAAHCSTTARLYCFEVDGAAKLLSRAEPAIVDGEPITEAL